MITCSITLLTTLVLLSHLVFRPFSDSLYTISENIQKFLIKKFHQDKTVIIKPFNTAVVIIYINNMKIQPHRDQVYKKNGDFDDNKNCQLQHTVTAILCLGNTRNVDFTLYQQKKKTIQKVGDIHQFNLTHGSLFVLHPLDEMTMVRSLYDRYGMTFFKHSSNGVQSDDEMSLGIVFRTTKHCCEVEKETGRIRVSCSDKTPVTKLAISTLEKYLAEPKRKKQNEDELKTAWKRTTMNYFS